MTLSHDVAGRGPAVVLLHAGVGDRRMWDPQWAPLATAGYQLTRCDFRGFGRTPAADRPHSDAADVRELLDTLGISQATLVGASYGGRVTLKVAARWPDRVTALALLCSGLPGHEPTDALRAFGAREEALIEAGDIEGAVELNVATWLGADADRPPTRRSAGCSGTPSRCTCRLRRSSPRSGSPATCRPSACPVSPCQAGTT